MGGFGSVTQEPSSMTRVSDLGWTKCEMSIKLIRKSWGALENINASNFTSKT
ncbi:hypothetical protein BDN71DRAFT_1443643 [Pleurotus eryngii]|uniref:Uncharacterized protein n=1 Tax=Pleurotus eryngii TaxID=5323 RepID=A0A9P6DB82_PLEER|nr:hypothetical protein BDN71DRAFT_1443643 [Pleurotus eryngii]